jgi:hypothetical protein
MAPGKSWCVDKSGYHPQTKGGQQLIHDQIVNDIKAHLFADNKSDPKLDALELACEGLENSMERMRLLDSDGISWKNKVADAAGGGAIETVMGLDTHFDHS